MWTDAFWDRDLNRKASVHTVSEINSLVCNQPAFKDKDQFEEKITVMPFNQDLLLDLEII